MQAYLCLLAKCLNLNKYRSWRDAYNNFTWNENKRGIFSKIKRNNKFQSKCTFTRSYLLLSTVRMCLLWTEGLIDCRTDQKHDVHLICRSGVWGVGMEIVFQRLRLSGVYSSWDVKVRSPYSCFLEGKERWLWI